MFDLIVEAFGESKMMPIALKKFGGKIAVSGGDGDNGK
jgi:hypothetical protein